MTSGSPFSGDEDRKRVRVEAEDGGERLDRFLGRALERDHGVELSRRAARRAIEAGAVWIDGHRVRVSSRAMRPGSVVEVVMPAGIAPRPADLPSIEGRVLFEDASLIAIDKPAGLPSQATPEDALGNAFEAVRRYLKTAAAAKEVYVALHHRLDRGTSGVLLMAKDRRANSGLAEVFRQGRVSKTYRALCVGSGEALFADDEVFSSDIFEIDLPLIRDGRKMSPIFEPEPLPSGARSASTDVRVVRRWVMGREVPLSWVEARPSTGRRHQIRAHLAAALLPVLGDRLYGEPAEPGLPEARRPMLHAASLELEHPVTGEPLRIEAPLPEDLEALLTGLGQGEIPESPDTPGGQ